METFIRCVGFAGLHMAILATSGGGFSVNQKYNAYNTITNDTLEYRGRESNR